MESNVKYARTSDSVTIRVGVPAARMILKALRDYSPAKDSLTDWQRRQVIADLTEVFHQIDTK